VTFLMTASGVTLWGVGSAFWGLVAGVATLLLLRGGRSG
jgi:benzoate membrane transport protein